MLTLVSGPEQQTHMVCVCRSSLLVPDMFDCDSVGGGRKTKIQRQFFYISLLDFSVSVGLHSDVPLCVHVYVCV